jgi:hypothetical protein
MVYSKIENHVLRKTTKCEHSFSCLSEDNPPPFCEVIAYNALSKVVKVKPTSDRSCPYRLALHTFRYCLCPTRVELYKQYNR